MLKFTIKAQLCEWAMVSCLTRNINRSTQRYSSQPITRHGTKQTI